MAERDCVKRIAQAGGFDHARAQRILDDLHDAAEVHAKQGAADPLKAAADELLAKEQAQAQQEYLAKLHEAIEAVAPPKEFQQAPIYYSAVARAVESAKQEKASPEQWLATIKNTSGVKQEEMEWLGLPDWLKEQKGAVTKQQIADYVRANEIEVKEVERGAGRIPTFEEWYAKTHIVPLAENIDDAPLMAIIRSNYERDKARMPREEATKFKQYTLPGGENYRELLLTLPREEHQAGNIGRYLSSFDRSVLDEIKTPEDLAQAKQYNSQLRETLKGVPDDRAFASIEEAKKIQDEGPAFKSSHWDEPNILAHIRFDDRVIDGKKTLHLAEVQSDWHQAGRRKGYRPEQEAKLAELVKERDAIGAEIHALGPDAPYTDEAARRIDHMNQLHDQIRELGGSDVGVPDAPFKTTWPELALKRMIRYAAENGYEKLSWDTGATNAERYDLSKQVKEIEYIKQSDGTYKLGITGINGDGIHLPKETYKPEELPDVLGKEVADKIVSGEGKRYRGHDGITLDGLDLKVGGEGMQGFYDKILPAAAAKLTKKFGAKIGESDVTTARVKSLETGEPEDTKYPVHTLDITPALKEAAVSQGFPLFQAQLGKITIRPDQRPIITLAKTADASTFIHESGHMFLENLMRWADHPEAPDTLKTDAKTALDWLGVENADAIKTKQHEKFARGFEQYMREGVAPSPELASVFAKFRDWLLRIYQTIKGLGTEITPDIRGVFDRMLASEPQRTVIAPDRMASPTLADVHEADAAHTEPHEAEPAMDRVLKEAEQFTSNFPKDAQNEHATSEAAIAAAAEPAGETGVRPGPEGTVEQGGGGPQPVAGGGAPGAAGGAELRGGGNAGAEGVAKPAGGERPVEPSHADAGLGDKPLAPRPKPQLGAAESPFTDKAGNIRLETLTTSEDVAKAIRDAAEQNQDFIGDRRGVVTDGQVEGLADDIGMAGAEKMLKERVKGQAFNAEQIMAARKLLVQSATDVSAAMKKAAAGTDEDVMAYAQAKDRHQMIQAQIAGITAEAGRALRAFRNISGMTGELQAVDQILRDATGKTLFQLRREAKLGAELKTPQQVSKFMQDAQFKNFGRMVLEYWINGLISGPVTHMTYAIGNEILTLQKAGPETAAAAGIGAMRRALGREGDTVRIGEVWQKLQAHGRALAPAAKAALDALKTGQTTTLPGERSAQNVLQFPGATAAEPALYDEAAKLSDVIASAYGVMRGIKDGFRVGGDIAAAGGAAQPYLSLQPSLNGAIPDIGIGKFNLPLGNALRLPSRLVASIHSFFRAINYSMEKAGDSFRTATNEGLTGTAFDQRMADLMTNPAQSKMEQFAHAASETTLMGQGGVFTQNLSKLLNTPFFATRDAAGNAIAGTGFPILKFIDPFVHISSNIIQQAVVERTPIGVLSKEMRADLMGRNGNIAQDTAMARMLVGTAYSVMLGGLAAEGYVSGSEPADPRQAATWRQAGNQAHSVRIGDIWYDVHRLGPLGMLLGIAADLYDVGHEASQGDMLLAASHLQHAVTQNILDESFMRGPSDLIRAVDDPGRYGEAYLKNFLSGFVPYSVGQGQIARAMDPYSRQARNVMDSIKAKIPGLSESLLPRRDIWGEPLPNKTAVGGAAVTAIYEQRVSRDPVNHAMLDLGIFPAQLQRKIRNVELSDAQYDDFQRIAGRMTKQRLDAIVNSPDYRTWPNHVKHDVIAEVITQSREAARGVMMMKAPEIVRQAAQIKLDRANGVAPR